MVPERRIQLTSLGINLKDELDAAIAAENRCLHAAEAEGITTAVHICLGTYILGAQGPLGGAGDYDVEITARLIDDLDADVFLIEYSDRVSTLEFLRGVGKDKTISLGILNVRDPRVETEDEVLRKIETATKYVPVESLSLCPNCGFSGGAADAFVTEDVEKQKLTVLARVADKVWP